MRGELLRCEGVLAIGRLALRFFRGIVVRVDDQLSFDLHRRVRLIVKVQSSAEAARRGRTGANHHIGRPDRGHPYRSVVRAFDQFVLLVPRSFGHPIGVDGFAAGSGYEHDKRGEYKSCCHESFFLGLKAATFGLKVGDVKIDFLSEL